MELKSRRLFPIAWNGSDGRAAKAQALFIRKYGKEMYCNLLTVPLTVFAIVMLHLQILQEERYLEETFGTAYREYKRHTLRYLGRR